MNVWKPLELAVTGAARLAWPAFQAVNRQFAEGSFQPKWAPAPLLKSRQRTAPGFGWPRTTDSLCPVCVRDARARILSGEQSIETLVEDHVGEIRAHILERDGKVIIEKTCPMRSRSHGTVRCCSCHRWPDLAAREPKPKASAVATSHRQTAIDVRTPP